MSWWGRGAGWLPAPRDKPTRPRAMLRPGATARLARTAPPETAALAGRQIWRPAPAAVEPDGTSGAWSRTGAKWDTGRIHGRVLSHDSGGMARGESRFLRRPGARKGNPPQPRARRLPTPGRVPGGCQR